MHHERQSRDGIDALGRSIDSALSSLVTKSLRGLLWPFAAVELDDKFVIWSVLQWCAREVPRCGHWSTQRTVAEIVCQGAVCRGGDQSHLLWVFRAFGWMEIGGPVLSGVSADCHQLTLLSLHVVLTS